MHTHVAVPIQSAWRAHVAKRAVRAALLERRRGATALQAGWRRCSALQAHRETLSTRHAARVKLQLSWRTVSFRRGRSKAAIAVQAAVRGALARRSTGRYFTIAPHRTCGHEQRWKAGVGDLVTQLSVMHAIGTACGLTYLHTPMHHSSAQHTLRRLHRGSMCVDDIDMDEFMGLGLGERSVDTMPRGVPTLRIDFDVHELEDAVHELQHAKAPCLLILAFSYDLINASTAGAAARFRRALGVPMRTLRARSSGASEGFGFARKYRLARLRDGFSCGWHGDALRVAVHVRRGDRAWVRYGSTVFLMHQGLWTEANLGTGRPHLDGTLSLMNPQQARLAEGIYARAPPAIHFHKILQHVLRLVSANTTQACARVHVLVVSDGFGEDYHTGFGDAVNAAFVAQQDADWALLHRAHLPAPDGDGDGNGDGNGHGNGDGNGGGNKDDWALPAAMHEAERVVQRTAARATHPHAPTCGKRSPSQSPRTPSRTCTLVVGNDETATRVAIDAMSTADLLLHGWSLLPTACTRHLAVTPPSRLDVTELREACDAPALPEEAVAAVHAGLVRCSRRAATAAAAEAATAALAAAVADTHAMATNEPLWAAEDLSECDSIEPSLQLARATLAVACAGQAVRVTRLRPDPRMALCEDYLSAAECAHLIHLGTTAGALHPSRVAIHHDTPQHDPWVSGGMHTAGRTSESCSLSTRDPIVARAVERAAVLCGLTPAHAEPPQLVHYCCGQQYRPHYDYHPPSKSRAARWRSMIRGNRLVSVFVYLSACEGGGRTAFPVLGQSFTPARGRALIWYNLDRDGESDVRTLHAGAPVTAGEKWGMNIWLLERPKPRLVRATVRVRLLPMWLDEPNQQVPGVRVELQPNATESPRPQPWRCLRCGDTLLGPVGLCLCPDRYLQQVPRQRPGTRGD